MTNEDVKFFYGEVLKMDVFHSNIEKFCFVLFLSIILFPIFGHTPLFGARHR